MNNRIRLSLAALAVGALFGGQAYAGDLPNGRYTIHPVNSDKCVDVAWASTADGANIAQVSCNGNNAQAFDVTDVGNGWYKMTNVNSGKAIDVAGNASNDGANIQQWSDNGSGAQRFSIKRVNGNEFSVINQTSGKCMDVAWGNTADGTNIQQWSCNGGAAQRYRFVPKSVNGVAVPVGRYSIKSVHSGRCLDIPGASTANGALLQQWGCNGTGAQAFDLSVRDGHYMLINANSGKALDVANWSTADGAQILQWDAHGGDNQRYAFTDMGAGQYQIRPKMSNKCLDVAGWGTNDGSAIIQWSCGQNQANQKWALGLSTFGGGTTGGGGSSGGGSTGGGSSGGGSTGGDFSNPPADQANMIEIGVKNGCGFPITVHGAGAEGVLQPDWAELKTGETRWYYAPQKWTAARVTAFKGGPQGVEMEKAEMTFVPQASGVVLNYNVTYVDWLGLPIKVNAVGGGADCRPASCEVAQASVLSGCPDGLRQGDKCIAPRTYCLDPKNQGTELCNRLNNEINRCASTKAGCGHAAGARTPEVYACSGAFANDPKWCAALNRAMLDNPDSTDRSLFYRNQPYNNYSKWVHNVCPGLYAFPYDDYPSGVDESGFRACTQGKRMEVTFCPKG